MYVAWAKGIYSFTWNAFSTKCSKLSKWSNSLPDCNKSGAIIFVPQNERILKLALKLKLALRSCPPNGTLTVWRSLKLSCAYRPVSAYRPSSTWECKFKFKCKFKFGVLGIYESSANPFTVFGIQIRFGFWKSTTQVPRETRNCNPPKNAFTPIGTSKIGILKKTS